MAAGPAGYSIRDESDDARVGKVKPCPKHTCCAFLLKLVLSSLGRRFVSALCHGPWKKNRARMHGMCTAGTSTINLPADHTQQVLLLRIHVSRPRLRCSRGETCRYISSVHASYLIPHTSYPEWSVYMYVCMYIVSISTISYTSIYPSQGRGQYLIDSQIWNCTQGSSLRRTRTE